MDDITKDCKQKWHRTQIVKTRGSNPYQVHDDSTGYVCIVLKYYDYQTLMAE
ncbi:MAG: hypothetical protein GQ475_00120 [Methylococcaceae bacterium]|nr:hypothetical protein [Methylococcaceae bacterium]